MTERELQALILTAEENYAHARDHENLRAQVTATLVAAAFVLVGLAIDSDVDGVNLFYVAVLAILIGILNIVVVVIHTNRFDRHVAIAREAKEMIAKVDVEVEKDEKIPKKKWSLHTAWLVVASLPIFAGVGLLLTACIA